MDNGREILELPSQVLVRGDEVANDAGNKKLGSIIPSNLIDLLLFLLFAALCFWQLGNYYLWSDECDTAVFARNILRTGLPYGFDGRNLYEYRNGVLLNKHLLNVYSPWLQYYLAALSFGVLGFGEFAARLPFVLCGIAAAVFTWLFVRRHYQDRRVATIVLLLMVTNAQFLMLIRQCRYYSVVCLLTVMFLWLYDRSRGKALALFSAGGLYLLFYFANPLVGLAVLWGLLLAFAICGDWRKALRFALVPAPVVLLVVGVYMTWLYRDGGPPDLAWFPHHAPLTFVSVMVGSLRALIGFLRVMIWTVKDYNEVGILPIGLFVVYGLVAVVKRSSPATFRTSETLKVTPLPFFAAVFASVLLALFASPPAEQAHISLRYAFAIVPLLLIFCASVLGRLFAFNRWVGAVLIAVTMFTGVLSFDVHAFYLRDFLVENARPFPNSTEVGVDFLRRNCAQDDKVYVVPSYMLSSMIYYLSDKLLFCGVLNESNTNILPFNPGLPKYISSVKELPQWVVMFGGAVDELAAGHLTQIDLENNYRRVKTAPFGIDTSRPELFWHDFHPVTYAPPEWNLAIYSKKQ